jgi:hypothetical protein
MNSVETILSTNGKYGKSLRSLQKELGISKRKVLRQVYMSKMIIDADPHLYGSGKTKINAFCFTNESELNYNERKKAKKVHKVVIQDAETHQTSD